MRKPAFDLDPVRVPSRRARGAAVSRVAVPIVAPLGACVAFWLGFAASLGACIDHPVEDVPPASKIFAHWDPLACGDDPHRVAIELYDDAGAQVAGSAPCLRGGLTLALAEWGRYRGRLYAAVAGEPARSEMPVEITVDTPLVQWDVDTPE